VTLQQLQLIIAVHRLLDPRAPMFRLLSSVLPVPFVLLLKSHDVVDHFKELRLMPLGLLRQTPGVARVDRKFLHIGTAQDRFHVLHSQIPPELIPKSAPVSIPVSTHENRVLCGVLRHRTVDAGAFRGLLPPEEVPPKTAMAREHLEKVKGHWDSAQPSAPFPYVREQPPRPRAFHRVGPQLLPPHRRCCPLLLGYGGRVEWADRGRCTLPMHPSFSAHRPASVLAAYRLSPTRPCPKPFGSTL